MEENTAIRIPRLKGESNFRSWLVGLKSHIMGKGLDDYIDGTEILPVKGAKEEDTAFSVRIKEWKKNNGQVMTVIINTVDASMIMTLKGFKVAKDMLNHLKKLYKPEGISYRFSVAIKYRDLVFNGKDLIKFYIKYDNVLKEAKQCSFNISAETALYNFIHCVSPYYAT